MVRPVTPSARSLAPALLTLGLVVGAAGCQASSSDSCVVPTEEISVIALVVDSGWDLRASIDFERGDRRLGGTPLELCETDRLTINGQTPDKTVKATSIEYSLELPLDGGRAVEFSLDRQALDERIELDAAVPDAFELLTPMDGDPITLGQAQTLEWEPAVPDSTFTVQLAEALGSAPCLRAPAPGADQDDDYLSPGGVQIADTGEWTVPAEALAPAMPPEACELTITLTRLALGQYPERLANGGRIEASAARYVDVRATP